MDHILKYKSIWKKIINKINKKSTICLAIESYEGHFIVSWNSTGIYH